MMSSRRQLSTSGLAGIWLALAAALPTPAALAQSAAHPSADFSMSPGRRFTEEGGEALYVHVCAACHQRDGKGAIGAAVYPALAANEKLAGSGYPLTVLLYGLRGMPPVGRMMDDRQVADIVNYVRTHFGNAYDDPVSVADVGLARPTVTAQAPAQPSPSPPAAPAPGGVVRYPIPGSDFPIAQAIEVPAGKATVYLSGFGPTVADARADKTSLAAFGDTRTQTASTLKAIGEALKRLNLGMGDVVKMTVFLVGDPQKGGKMDFSGLMDAYRAEFGTAAQPNLPTRSVVQVSALANPGWLVEIEVTAIRR